MGGDTSYDYGAAIVEDRTLVREKYSELKLQANFLKASSAYLTATSQLGVNGSFTTTDEIAVTQLLGNGTKTNFYVIRHANWTSTDNTNYKLVVPTSEGNFTIPQLGGTLSLNGRDSKIHVTDYDVGGINLVYSSAEVFTWAKGAKGRRVLVLYGGEKETHELAFPVSVGSPAVIEGGGVTIKRQRSLWVIHWEVNATRRVIQIGELQVYLLWRNDAYNYWVAELPAPPPIGSFSSPSKSTIVLRAGYLIRNAEIEGQQLKLTGDVNATTPIEIISTPQESISTIIFNGKALKTSKTKLGSLSATVTYNPPKVSPIDFSTIDWKYLDSLPEIKPSYDDSLWTALTKTTTTNPRQLTTPTSLYATDYGYHAGSLLYRGHFLSNGQESFVFLNTSGGIGFGHSVWLNNSFLGSYTGGGSQYDAQNFSLTSPLKAGSPFVLTVLIDHTGQDEEAPGTDAVKFPRGILDYEISGHDATDIEWKMTGNLGGEQYRDLARGPLNEGAMFAERMGYHLPNPPSSSWQTSNPVKDGISEAGIGFYATSFELDLPEGYDIPSYIVFNTSTTTGTLGHNYRCQFYVNGYQFGKYSK